MYLKLINSTTKTFLNSPLPYILPLLLWFGYANNILSEGGQDIFDVSFSLLMVSIGIFLFDDSYNNIWKEKIKYILITIGTYLAITTIFVIVATILYLMIGMAMGTFEPVVLLMRVYLFGLQYPLYVISIVSISLYPLIYFLGASLQQEHPPKAFLKMMSFMNPKKWLKIFLSKEYFKNILRFLSIMVVLQIITTLIIIGVNMYINPNVSPSDPSTSEVILKQENLERTLLYFITPFTGLISTILSQLVYKKTGEI